MIIDYISALSVLGIIGNLVSIVVLVLKVYLLDKFIIDGVIKNIFVYQTSLIYT